MSLYKNSSTYGLDPVPERRLGADVEEPGHLPEDVDVADQVERAGVVDSGGEAAPLLRRAVQRVEVQTEGNGEDGVHRRFHHQALIDLIEETYIQCRREHDQIRQYNQVTGS